MEYVSQCKGTRIQWRKMRLLLGLAITFLDDDNSSISKQKQLERQVVINNTASKNPVCLCPTSALSATLKVSGAGPTERTWQVLRVRAAHSSGPLISDSTRGLGSPTADISHVICVYRGSRTLRVRDWARLQLGFSASVELCSKFWGIRE